MAKLHVPAGWHGRREDGSRPSQLCRWSESWTLRVDFHPSEPRIFVDSVTRISYNSSSSKMRVDHRPVAGRFAVSVDLGAAPCPRAHELGPDPCSSPPALRVFRAKRRRACAANPYLWPVNIMDGPVRECLSAGR